jgi:S-methylmethionine-dependent homocysteine/selenocysteine methylase
LLVNCVPPRDIGRPLAELAAASPVAFGAYGHLGMPESHCGWEFTGDDTPARYAAYAAEWLQQGATIVGGCCGTTPAHIAAIRHLGYERNT